MEQKWLSDKQVAARYSVSRITIWRWAREVPEFPTPHKISGNVTRWHAPEIDAFDKRMLGATG